MAQELSKYNNLKNYDITLKVHSKCKLNCMVTSASFQNLTKVTLKWLKRQINKEKRTG